MADGVVPGLWPGCAYPGTFAAAGPAGDVDPAPGSEWAVSLLWNLMTSKHLVADTRHAWARIPVENRK